MFKKEYYPPSTRDWENYENYDDYLKSVTNNIQSMNCIVCEKTVGAQSSYLDRHKKCHARMQRKYSHKTRKCCICNIGLDDTSPFCDKHEYDQFRTLSWFKSRNLYGSINARLPKTAIMSHVSGYIMPDGTFYKIDESYHGDVSMQILYSIDIYTKHSDLDLTERFLKITGAVRVGHFQQSDGSHTTVFEYYDLNDTQKNIIYDIHADLGSNNYCSLDGHGHPSEKLLNRKMLNVVNHV